MTGLEWNRVAARAVVAIALATRMPLAAEQAGRGGKAPGSTRRNSLLRRWSRD